MTTELIENGGELLTKSLTLLKQASYYIGYLPQELKKENRIYIKKPDKEKKIIPRKNHTTSYHYVPLYKKYMKNNCTGSNERARTDKFL